MIFGDIIDRTAEYLDRTDLGTSSSSPLSSTKIAHWINDTRKHIALQYNFDYLYVEATIETSGGSGTYALPSDYMGHLSVFSEGYKLARVGAREFDELAGNEEDALTTQQTLFMETEMSSGAPTYYIDRGMSIQLWPTPDIAYTILLKYYAQPADFLTSSDEDYISRFHFEAIIFGAALRGAVFLDDEQKKTTFMTAYQTAIAEMVKREKEKYTTDTHVRLKSWMDYDLNTFKRLLRINNSD